MSSNNLKLVSPETMSQEDALEWAKNCFAKAAQICTEARDYWETMHKHHANLSELMAELKLLNDSVEDRERRTEILEVAQEVLEAIIDLRNGMQTISKGSVSLEDLDTDWKNSREDYRKASELLERRYHLFLENYTNLKHKLGFKTQEEIARITGIDRRQISRIETGKSKPQFKTISKIADAFGVKASDLFPSE